MAKPDERSDNVQRLQRSINDTVDNFEDTKDYRRAHEDEIGDEQRRDLKVKNAHRSDAIEGFRSEIKDEARHQQSQHKR